MTGAAFLLLALALVAALGNWVAVDQGHKGLEYLCKPLTMVLLIATTLSLDVHDETVRTWFVVALVLCLVGDVFLMLPQDLFVFGLGSFLLGHVAYVGGMLIDGVTLPRLGIGVLLVLVAMGVLGQRIIGAVKAGDEPALAGPVTAYVVVISAMVATAVGTGRAAAIAGAASFYASDAVIAWNRFVAETRRHRLVIMVTYHLGQIGLVLSLV